MEINKTLNTMEIPNLPNDILIKILNIDYNRKLKETKQKYNHVILHLEQYIDECIDDEDDLDDELYSIGDFIYMCYNNNIRIDCRFLEYNNLWNTESSEIIKNKYGEDRIDYFIENEF